MAETGIVARFPLGVYHGHRSGSATDPLPAPARLYSALVSAAYLGTTADVENSQPREDIARALTWLEDHPPTGLRLPASMGVTPNKTGCKTYRETVLSKKGPKKEPKVISDGIAINGEMAWSWDAMPTEVHEALMALCPDVPCLGEMDSPVVLEVTAVEPSWRRDPDATAFTPGGIRFDVAQAGRLDELRKRHAEARPDRPPTAARDRWRLSEEERPVPPSFDCVAPARFAPVEPPVSAAPWKEVFAFTTGEDIPPQRRVGWCVAFHRALVSRIGDGAPSTVTGRYARESPRAVPPNRVAIQYIPAALAGISALADIPTPSDHGVFLVMLPLGISADDAQVIRDALVGMTQLRSRWGKAALALVPEVFGAEGFWRPAPSGLSRLWSPTPVAVPEVTRQRGRWCFEDAILLSLGFVWRDQIKAAGRGRQAYRATADEVRSRGASVLWYSRETKHADAYVHRIPDGLVAQPYRALIDAGDLMRPTLLAAVGQSRHLGGGLLAPVDVPPDLTASPGKGGAS
mgnify:FL=1